MRVLASKLVAGLLLTLSGAFCCASETTPLVFESGEAKVPLVELYTSEGCSSCPPAESWFSSLTNNPELWKKFVPVSFHVDYWNSLGWPDPYSSEEFTARQRYYGEVWQSGIYTPEFVLDGREWRPFEGNFAQTGKIVGNLKGIVTLDGKLEIIFVPRFKPIGAMVAEVALLGTGIQTAVHRGENAGKTLKHDFLTLCLLKCSLEPSPAGEYRGYLTLPERTLPHAAAIAVWVRRSDAIAPSQAAGCWLKRN